MTCGAGCCAPPRLQCWGHGDKPGDTKWPPQGVMGQVTPVAGVPRRGPSVPRGGPGVPIYLPVHLPAACCWAPSA